MFFRFHPDRAENFENIQMSFDGNHWFNGTDYFFKEEVSKWYLKELKKLKFNKQMKELLS